MTAGIFVRIASIILFIVIIIWIAILRRVSGDDDSQVHNMFLLSAMAAIVGAFIFVTMILPLFGEAVSTAVLSSGEEIEADPFSKAHSKVAQGDYNGAIGEFLKLAKEEPTNRRHFAEITKIYLDKLHDPDGAIQCLNQALANPGWQDEDAAFFLFRLEDIHLKHRGDTERAIEILQQIVEQFPDSRHSANAIHNLRDIDPELVSGIVPAGVTPPPPRGATAQPAVAASGAEPPVPKKPSLPVSAEPPLPGEPPKPNV